MKRSQGDCGRSRWYDHQSRNRFYNWKSNDRLHPRDKGKGELWNFGDATSIFISNLPSPLEINTLRALLSPLGTLVDLFIVNRRDKHGYRFGFAKFNRVKDVKALIENITKLEIQGRRIFATTAKFEQKEKQEKPQNIDLRKVINSNKERRNIEEVKTYAEAARGVKQSPQSRKEPEFNKEEERKEQEYIRKFNSKEGYGRNFELEGRFVGEVKNIKSLIVIKSVLMGEGFRENSIDYLGGFWILITPKTGTNHRKLKEESNLRSWFNTLKPWDKSFKVRERIIWLNIEGIPIHAWSTSVLIQVARIWGEVLQTDTCQFVGNMCHRSLVCIKTTNHNLIWTSEKIMVDDDIHTIRIKEVEIKELSEFFRTIPDKTNDEDEDQREEESSDGDSSSDDEFPASEPRSDSEDEGFSYIPNSVDQGAETIMNPTAKLNASLEKEENENTRFNAPKENVAMESTHPIIDLNKEASKEEDSGTVNSTGEAQSNSGPDFSSPIPRAQINNQSSKDPATNFATSRQFLPIAENNTPTKLPEKPRMEKQKTRMEEEEGSKADQSKKGAIKTLKFSPRVTRSKSKWGKDRNSDSSATSGGDTGSCSVNIEEQNYAYKIGRSIGFGNRGCRDYQFNPDSNKGENTSLLKRGLNVKMVKLAKQSGFKPPASCFLPHERDSLEP